MSTTLDSRSLNSSARIINHVSQRFAALVSEFESSTEFQQLESGAGARQDYDKFIINLILTHLNSPQLFALLYALAPRETALNLRDNLIEELGADHEGIPHPELLLQLLTGSSFTPLARHRIERAAQAGLLQTWSEKLPEQLQSMREYGLRALLEIGSFEWMLSKLASRMAVALAKHRGISTEGLEWFTHHSEVDAAHAAQAVQAVAAYVQAYAIEDWQYQSICDLTFTQNPFLKRYFMPDHTLALLA